MNVNTVYKIWIYCLNKNNQQGYASPDDFNLLINQGATSFLDYLLGEFQSYAYGKPLSKVQFGMNEQVRQRLTPLIQKPVTLTVDNTGFAAYPDDYQQMDAIYDSTGNNRIRYVPQQKKYSYINSQIDPVATNPIYLIIDQGFQFYPITIGSALLSYVKTPPTIVWNFNLDSNGLPEYTSVGSVDPVFYDVDMLEIIARALSFAGLNLSLPQVEQYAQSIIKGGQ